MTYTQAVQYLFDSAPLFQNIGAAAYKEGLDNTLALDAHFSHPHRNYRTIHVGGTNGKGSVSHTLAAILQAQGYRVGLYTSPHLVDFRERIRVNGKMISKKRVVEFVNEFKSQNSETAFSFFELATALAFQYFAEQKVDFAVIEVGLGGRLDCTNIIQPELSVITNISFDHIQFLGDTLPKIASEKAGIIKPGTPVCIGENVSPEVKAVFADKAREVGAPITFAEDEGEVLQYTMNDCSINYETRHFGSLCGTLAGLCQEKNTATILNSVLLLRKRGITISDKAVRKGLAEVTTMTGLMGRWQILSREPLTICDTAHNKGGLSYIFRHLAALPRRRLHLVFGMVSDKDVDGVLSQLSSLIPEPYSIYFTQASVRRAMPAEEVCQRASAHGLHGTAYPDVASAYAAAQKNASAEDIIYIGGSTFVVADMLKSIL
ncbi:MAG: bifunctional folylpolyglutamate synthase/dihydrofolate synthase [Bacteroidaceae bacterium]|nr:bifunctional folylpolyglutamate synthase/dihydrofolate synthase [Bacteroidaceae bacterium]